ncbi:MAG TPA: class I SAM-dependent methyltransferase [Pseudonocardiaceae bacterium]|nr:class I SAM-dependent methyltransferase [Pseudonocardiaceae bacterium]
MNDLTSATVDRVLAAAADATDLIAIAIGDRLGYYAALTEHGPCTDAELAGHAGTSRRYAQEWLEQQAVAGFVEVDDSADRRFALADGVAGVMAEPEALTFLAPLARQFVAAAAQVPAIADAARSGGGVPWSAYGPDMREAQGDLNRPGFLRLLAREWLDALPDVRDRLARAPAARVADVGCGAGWSSIAIARGYPLVHVDAFELDPASVRLARDNVAAEGLADRVRVHEVDIGAVATHEPYDLVMAFECVHDMPYPVQALQAMGRLAGDRGTVLVADMKVGERFSPPGDLVERLMYGFSLSVCLPDSMSHPESAATGTAMRPDTFRQYAELAGFAGVDTLDVDHDFWRFYRLRSC